LENRIVEYLFSGIRQLVAVAMILLGAVLAGNFSMGPCGGTILAEEPFPAIFVCILGLELIFCSYFVVRKLKAEADFRVIIYFFLVMWSLALLAPVIDLARFHAPHTQQEISDLYFSALRGGAATLNLALFYRWFGARNMITRVW
jgi:hypothetical protein